jgi:hypothetical protein
MPEVAGGGACLIDPFDVDSIRDGLIRIVQDDAFRDRLVKLGFRNVERFQAPHVAGMYAAIYAQLSATSQSKAAITTAA